MNKLYLEIKEAIKRTCDLQEPIGIAFSGGVDSSLLATMCKDIGYDTTLLTIGFDGSHDIEFATKISAMMDMKHKIKIIDEDSFADVSARVLEALPSCSISWIENCIAFYYVSMFAKTLNIRTVLTANGIDELFCGYDSYRRMEDQSEKSIKDAMDKKIENELNMICAISEFTHHTGVSIYQPLLSKEFIKYAKSIPLDSKIRGKDDMLRKHAIRELAVEIGVPKLSATKRKKALQYGTKIHKNLLKSKSFSQRRDQ